MPLNAPRNQRIDVRTYVADVSTPAMVDKLGALVDDLPVYAPSSVSIRPIRYLTDRTHPRPVVRTADGREATAVLYSGSGAIESLEPLDGPLDGPGATSGLWLADVTADALGVVPGAMVTVELVGVEPPTGTPTEFAELPVVGIYRTVNGLPSSTTLDWAAIADDLPDDPLRPAAVAPLLIADQATVVAASRAIGETDLVIWDASWDGPLGIDRARQAAAAVEGLGQRLRDPNDSLGAITAGAGIDSVVVVSGIGQIVASTDASTAELRPLVTSMGLGTQAVAAVVVLSAGWLLVGRRQRELSLALSQGIRAGQLAALAVVEHLLVIVVGVLVGVGAVRSGHPRGQRRGAVSSARWATRGGVRTPRRSPSA